MVYNGSVSPLLLPPVGLIQEFHTLAVKTAPVVAVKERMQGLAEDPRRLLEKLLKLFAQVHCVQYSLLQCIANYPSTIDSVIPWKYCRSNGCRWSAIVAHLNSQSLAYVITVWDNCTCLMHFPIANGLCCSSSVMK